MNKVFFRYRLHFQRRGKVGAQGENGLIQAGKHNVAAWLPAAVGTSLWEPEQVKLGL